MGASVHASGEALWIPPSGVISASLVMPSDVIRNFTFVIFWSLLSIGTGIQRRTCWLPSGTAATPAS